MLIKTHNPKYNKIYNDLAEFECVEILQLLEDLKTLSKNQDMVKNNTDFEERKKIVKNLNYIIDNYKKYTKKELSYFLKVYTIDKRI